MHRRLAIFAMAMLLTTGGCGAVVGAAARAPFKVGTLATQMSTARVKNAVALAQGAVKVAEGGVQTMGSTVELIDTIGQTVHNGKMRNVALQQARVELQHME